MDFTNGHLCLRNTLDIEVAERSISPHEVHVLSIGAKCFRSISVPELILKIQRYSNIQKLRLSDDYIPNERMEKIKEQILSQLGSVAFEWSYDLLVDGKHGR